MRNSEEKVLEFFNELRERFSLGEPLAEMPPDVTVEEYLHQADITRICPAAVAVGRPCGYCGVSIMEMRINFPDFVRKFIIDHDNRLLTRMELETK